jgi:hypothetical protein
MTSDRPLSGNERYWDMPENRARMVIDDRGTEWEVYDEATWSLQLALEWDFLPQTENPGLIFASRVGRRRLWPCPANWKTLEDAEVLELLNRAKAML